MSTVRRDGRVFYDVNIKADVDLGIPGAPELVSGKTLVADTGAGITLIPFGNVQSWFGFSGMTMGPILGGRGVGGGFPYAKLNGCTMDVGDIGDPNLGPQQTRGCPNIFVHFKQEITPGTEGILGMDQFDQLGVDPVKSADGRDGWLRPRT